MFKALVLNQENEKVTSSIQQLSLSELPEGDVVVDVEYSTLNYKDGLVLNGLGGLVRNYPHIGGIDFAGTVSHSDHNDFNVGDKVVLTGWRVGEVHWGGYAEKARVKGDWLIKLPEGITPKQAMAVGTAGFTAMLGVLALEAHGVSPNKGEVLVTGAAGGVGSIAASLLAKRGYAIAGSSGRKETHDYLKSIGVTTIIERDELAEESKRPLEKERWAGCIDAVGGTTLARVLSQMQYGGSVAAIGLAGGNQLNTTVIPFLLRGVNLLGIDSVMCPKDKRHQAWQEIVKTMDLDTLQNMITEATLEELPALSKDILKGQIRGRLVVSVK